MTEMQLTITRNAIRYRVGRVIECPACKSIMDCRRAVEIDFHHANGELVHSAIRCATCFDAVGERFRTAAAAKGLTVEVHDGRTLWQATGPVTPRVRKTAQAAPIVGRTYYAKHTSGMIRFRLDAIAHRPVWRSSRTLTRYVGTNLETGRQVELKSRAKLLREVV